MAALPNKLFDVRNGNDSVDKDTTVYPTATLIVFKDAAAKVKIIDAFATAYNYQTTVPDPANPNQQIPNPQSKQNFYQTQITSFIKETYRAVQIKAAEVSAANTAKTTADGELP